MAAPTRIGTYAVERELGRGGMGIVYLARDPRLQRPVAIKVLPDAFAQDPERLARFEREARLLASLNHPDIAGIYGLEEADGHRFLALEYVEGETLAERIARGPLPLDEVMSVGRQIAAALEAAHENGVIHRDLKPGNVKLTPGGDVKVLDFGLAKGAAGSPDSGPNLTQSPTIAFAATGAGVILGTAAYMSPEQARGKPVDRRTDIRSFGCVLYECLTRRQLFSGETASDVIAKILEREPDWTALPGDTPPKVRELLRRALEKDARQRLRDIGDARIELEEALAARTSSGRIAAAAVTEERRTGGAIPPSTRVAWGVAMVALVAVALAIFAPDLFRRPPVRSPVRFSIPAPPGITLNEDAVECAISPDGRMVAFTAVDSTGNTQLWLRSLDAIAARPVAGTDIANEPFWSPDSRFIGFFADGKLKKIPVAGGSAEALCDAKNGRGGTWNRDDVIVFAPEGGGPLFRISAAGGEVRGVTTLDSTRHETAHRFPTFLPDGKHFTFLSLPARAGKFDIWIGSLDSPKVEHLTSADGAPAYSTAGYLLFPRGRTLVAQRFDPGSRRLSGEPIALPDVPGSSQSNGYRAVTVSDGGALAYMNGRVVNTRLVWLDRSGHETGTVAMPPARYEIAALSPDARFAAVSRTDTPLESDIWLIELERSVATRFTFGPARNGGSMVWSPDGKNIAFESDRKGPFDIYVKPASGAVPETVLFASDAAFKHPYAWSLDGRFIPFEQLDAQTGWDLWVLPANGTAPPTPYLRTPFNERWPSISPDGRWMCYASDESGRFEIYVQSFPASGNKYRVSPAGGFAPLWRGDGREVIFYGPDFSTLMAADVRTSPAFNAGVPRALFRFPPGAQIPGVTSDFKRFLVPVPAGDNTASSITVVLDWAAALPKR